MCLLQKIILLTEEKGKKIFKILVSLLMTFVALIQSSVTWYPHFNKIPHKNLHLLYLFYANSIEFHLWFNIIPIHIVFCLSSKMFFLSPEDIDKGSLTYHPEECAILVSYVLRILHLYVLILYPCPTGVNI